MAVKRIKYKLKEGLYTNTTPLVNGKGHKIQIEYSLESFTFKVLNRATNNIYRGGEGVNNYQTLLRHIRKRIGVMGVAIESEIRNV